MSTAEQAMTTGIEEIRRLTSERDELRRLNRDWEVGYAKIKAENDMLKGMYAENKRESDGYKAYSVELRAQLQTISAVINKAVGDARGKMLEETQPKPKEQAPPEPQRMVERVVERIPGFLQEGPDHSHDHERLEAITHRSQ